MAKAHYFRHLNIVNRHRFLVFCHCVSCGFFWRGLVHDLSKYEPAEFIKSACYYQGTSSPVMAQRKAENLYSSICVHHTKKNRHHFEYWIDIYRGDLLLHPMPYPYAVEYCCDVIAASQTYNGKSFRRNLPYDYFQARMDHYLMAKATKEFVLRFLKEYAENGFRNLKRKTTRKWYSECLSRNPDVERVPVLSRENEEGNQKSRPQA